MRKFVVLLFAFLLVIMTIVMWTAAAYLAYFKGESTFSLGLGGFVTGVVSICLLLYITEPSIWNHA